MQKNCLNLIPNIMKKLTYFIVFLSLISILTSCTAEELEPVTNQTTAHAKDDDITPPPPPTPIKQ